MFFSHFNIFSSFNNFLMTSLASGGNLSSWADLGVTAGSNLGFCLGITLLTGRRFSFSNCLGGSCIGDWFLFSYYWLSRGRWLRCSLLDYYLRFSGNLGGLGEGFIGRSYSSRVRLLLSCILSSDFSRRIGQVGLISVRVLSSELVSNWPSSCTGEGRSGNYKLLSV